MNYIINNTYKKIILSFICTALFIILTPINTFAKVPEDISKAAYDSVLIQFKDSLDADREYFGLSATDELNTLTLGEGVEYQTLDFDKINSKNNNLKNILKVNNEKQYIFPVKVNNKPCGIVFVEKFKGKWTAVQMSSDLTFENKLMKAKQNFKNKGININDTTPILYDRILGLSAIYEESSNTIALLDDNTALNIKENTIKKYEEIKNNLIKVKNEMQSMDKNNQIGGAPSQSNTTTNIVITSVTIILIGLIVIIKTKIPTQ